MFLTISDLLLDKQVVAKQVHLHVAAHKAEEAVAWKAEEMAILAACTAYLQ